MSPWKVHLWLLGALLAVVAVVAWADLNREVGYGQGLFAWAAAMAFALYAGLTTGVVAIFRLELRSVIATHAVPCSVALAVAGAWVARLRPEPAPASDEAPIATAEPVRPQAPPAPQPKLLMEISPFPAVASTKPATIVSFGPPTYDAKAIGTEKLLAYFRSRSRALGQCVEKFGARRHGSLVLRFDIMPTGRTSSISVEQSTLENELADACLKTVLRGWVFPFKPEADARVSMPVRFEPVKVTDSGERFEPRDRAVVDCVPGQLCP